jgi:hypothetical protein
MVIPMLYPWYVQCSCLFLESPSAIKIAAFCQTYVSRLLHAANGIDSSFLSHVCGNPKRFLLSRPDLNTPLIICLFANVCECAARCSSVSSNINGACNTSMPADVEHGKLQRRSRSETRMWLVEFQFHTTAGSTHQVWARRSRHMLLWSRRVLFASLSLHFEASS